MVPTAERIAGAHYRAIELVGRRRVYRRTHADVDAAARRAGLRIDPGPSPAGVSDLYVLRDRSAEQDEPGGDHQSSFGHRAGV